MIDTLILEWLLDGDVSIQYQVYRDLLDTDKPDLKARIASEGWGARFLSLQKENGHWGLGFYQPKWISTHYTLLDLKNISLPNKQTQIDLILNKIFEEGSSDRHNQSALSLIKSDVCVSGMFLNYASYFGAGEEGLKSVVDYILPLQLADGGFNCQLTRKGANHSSLHSTLSVIEGILEYAQQGYTYRLPEMEKAAAESRLFILEHKLFKSHRTGEIINNKMLMLSHPSRWRYDILRALDYFQFAGIEFDCQMADALGVLLRKQRPDNKWPVQAKHPGKTHFEMEKSGGPSRWNTLRVLRVLKHFGWLDKI